MRPFLVAGEMAAQYIYIYMYIHIHTLHLAFENYLDFLSRLFCILFFLTFGTLYSLRDCSIGILNYILIAIHISDYYRKSEVCFVSQIKSSDYTGNLWVVKLTPPIFAFFQRSTMFLISWGFRNDACNISRVWTTCSVWSAAYMMNYGIWEGSSWTGIVTVSLTLP